MIAVTTQSRTRAFRYMVPMFLAGRIIERGLKNAPGCERYANVIAGPREFWTLTIWRDPCGMRKYMRGGAHGRLMWQQPRWLESYWGMQWRPGTYRSGNWEAEPWQAQELDAAESDSRTPEAPTSAVPTWMQTALNQGVRLEERQVAGMAGATYRLRVEPWGLAPALRDVRLLRRVASADEDSIRLSLGFGTGAALYLLVIAGSDEALERLRAAPEHRHFLGRWGESAWCSSWEPRAEFGQWERRKLREGRFASAQLLVDTKLEAQPSAAREARQTIQQHVDGLDAESLDVVRLLTSELVANSARHAGLGPTDQVGLQVRSERDWVRVEVIDRGRRFEPRIPLSKTLEDGSGWGLYIVNRLADRWGTFVRSRQRHVWFELQVPVAVRDEAAAA